MSMASSPDYLLRSEDQGLKALFPTVEASNTFEEFFNEDLYGADGHSTSEEHSKSPVHFLEKDSGSNEYPRLPSFPESAILAQSPAQPWKKGLWCLAQQPPATVAVDKVRGPQPDSSATASLLDNDNLALRYPRSSPASPSTKRADLIRGKTRLSLSRHIQSMRLPQSREATLSPSPAYSQLPLHTKMEQVETWQQDFQNFSLRAPRDGGQSSRARGQYIPGARKMNAANARQNASVTMGVPRYHAIIGDLSEAHDTGLIDPNLVQQINLGASEASGHPEHHGFGKQYDHLEHLPTPLWMTESLHSSSSSHQSYDAMPPSNDSTQSGSSGHGVYNVHIQPWVSPPTESNPNSWNHSRQMQQLNIAAPMPQRSSAQALVQSYDQGPGGLGIHYPELEQMEQSVYHEPLAYMEQVHSSNMIPYSPSASIPHGLPIIPPLPMPPSHNFTSSSPFTTPRRTRRSPSRSPSIGISPTNVTPRSLRMRSPTRSGHEHHHHRRKSIHKSGPIKDTHEPLPPINTSSHARSRLTSKAPRTPRTPKTPNAVFGSIDFINFTPRDSAKLLSDVAPSGSSKTRARREAEARDKRKKLSEAALKAVTSAGGDVEAYKKAILA